MVTISLLLLTFDYKVTFKLHLIWYDIILKDFAWENVYYFAPVTSVKYQSTSPITAIFKWVCVWCTVRSQPANHVCHTTGQVEVFCDQTASFMHNRSKCVHNVFFFNAYICSSAAGVSAQTRLCTVPDVTTREQKPAALAKCLRRKEHLDR